MTVRIVLWAMSLLRWGGFGLLGMIAAWILNLGYLIATNNDAPLMTEAIGELDHAAQRGGVLEIIVTVRRDKDCNGTVERWLRRVREVDGKPMMQDGVPVEEKVLLLQSGPPPVPLHVRVTYILPLQLPLSVNAGTWYYWTRSQSDCRFGSQFLATVFGKRQYETAGLGSPIVITDPNKASPAQVSVPNGPVTMVPTPGAK